MNPPIERGPDCTVVVTDAMPAVIVVQFEILTDEIRSKLNDLPTEPAFFKFGGSPSPLETLASDLYEYLGRRFMANSKEYTVDSQASVICLPCNDTADPTTARRHIENYLVNRAGLRLGATTGFDGDR